VVPRESVDASAAVWTDASTPVSARVQTYGWKKSHVLFFRMGENLSKCRKRQTYNNWLAENKTANCTTWKVLEVECVSFLGLTFCAELSGVSRRANALAVGASSSVHADGATRLAVCT
jgi:hypothetical protein